MIHEAGTNGFCSGGLWSGFLDVVAVFKDDVGRGGLCPLVWRGHRAHRYHWLVFSEATAGSPRAHRDRVDLGRCGRDQSLLEFGSSLTPPTLPTINFLRALCVLGG